MDRSEQRLVNTYGNQDFHRAISIRASGSPSEAVYANGRISFEVALEPGQAWHACLSYELSDGDSSYPAPPRCSGQAGSSGPSRVMAEWRAGVTKLASGNSLFERLYAQALDDMAALRLPFESMSSDGASCRPRACPGSSACSAATA